jgi:hypothetical protein
LDTSHPEHKEYLLRDLRIVNVFFGKKGVETRDSQEVLDSIVSGESWETTGAGAGAGTEGLLDTDDTTTATTTTTPAAVISDEEDSDTVLIK